MNHQMQSGVEPLRAALRAPPPCPEDWLAQVVDVLSRAGRLTPAQREVLRSLMLGRAYCEIATIRGTSPHTVGVQVKAILRRLDAANSRDLFRVFLCALERDTCRVSGSDESLEVCP